MVQLNARNLIRRGKQVVQSEDEGRFIFISLLNFLSSMKPSAMVRPWESFIKLCLFLDLLILRRSLLHLLSYLLGPFSSHVSSFKTSDQGGKAVFIMYERRPASVTTTHSQRKRGSSEISLSICRQNPLYTVLLSSHFMVDLLNSNSKSGGTRSKIKRSLIVISDIIRFSITSLSHCPAEFYFPA